MKPVMRPGRSVRSSSSSRGVSLIEILVGIAIGLIGMLVMFQMVTVWDARTRISTSSGNAQIAGSLAMFNIESDLQRAGMGFGTATQPELGCTVAAFDNAASGTANFTLAPIVITDGDPTGVPDTIDVLYGNSAFFDSAEPFTTGSATTLQAKYSKFGFKRGDVAVMSDQAGTCRLIQITDDTTPDQISLTFGTGTYTNFYDGNVDSVRWNSATASMPSISTGALYNLGPIPHHNFWSVDTASTTLGFVSKMSSVNTNQFFGVAEGVVDMKAQYGYDANGDKVISDAEWTKTPPADWTKVRAIRIALLVRSRDYEQPPAAASSDVETPTYLLTTPPTYFGGLPFAMTNLDGTPDSDVRPSPNNWRYYRYRVYEKVIPLRNVIWGQSS